MGTKEKTDAVAALLNGEAPAAARASEHGEEEPGERRSPRKRRDSQGDAAAGGAGDEDRELHDSEAEEGSEHRGADDGDDEQGEDEDEREHDDDDAPTLDDLAKHAGLTTADLNKLPVKLGAGVTLTLGEMKQRWSELVKLDETRAEFEQHREQQELEAIDAHRRIRAIVDAFPAGSVPPRVMERLEAQFSETVAREAELLHRARPEWRDAKYAAAQRTTMLALGKKYGFSPAELAGITDHRQVLLLQDFARELGRRDAAKEAARRVEPGTDKRPGQETQRAANGTATRPRNLSRRQDISAKVARLIDSR